MTGIDNHLPVSIAVLGADERQQQLAKELKHRFHPAAVIYEALPEKLSKPVDYIVLPIRGLELTDSANWLGRLDKRTKILAGKIDADFTAQCENHQIELFSYTDRTGFKIANAVPTAEGAMKLYMELSKQTIADMRMLVLGFGHCGKALAVRLKALGADVTVFARSSEDRIYGKTMGLDMREYKQLPKLVRQKTCIFNTVPYRILDASILKYMPKSSIIIDLASIPGGTDFELCEKLQLNGVHALSLPGRFFPKTAGKILADTIVNMITETKH
ncbi:MAG: NAD(P)-dependent oxidoreductase [Lachnospiraceae bacterium]